MKHKIELKDAFKTFTLDQDKIKSPEETVSTFRGKIKHLNSDIFKEARRIDNGRLNIPVCKKLLPTKLLKNRSESTEPV